MHALVARSTFGSQNVQSTPCSDHFSKLRCSKSARRCCAKHISKSKCKTHHVQSTFGSWDVETVHAVVAPSTFRNQIYKKTSASEHFWGLRRLKSARRCGANHISKWKVLKTDGLGPPLDVQMSFRMAGARDCAPCEQNVRVLSQFQLQPPLPYTTLH